jgi:hypothetical protein
MGRARMSTSGEREGNLAKGATWWRKHIPKNAPKAHGPVGPGERQQSARRGGTSRVELGWPGRILKDDSNGKMIFEFQWNLKLGKTLRNSTRRFRRNLEKRVFLNFSRLLKDF